ncbi:MAG: SRPBCC domain-containing protein [Betaproteobacteria bacterium]|nr:SRPBCC domain-containing protein [Betaproteobacteria bacterium]
MSAASLACDVPPSERAQRGATTSRPSPTEIVIARWLDAPRDLVFEVWTDPKHIREWWGPEGFSNTRCEADFRVGGEFHTHLLGPDGVTYPCKGIYREIVVPERVVYEGVPDDGHPCGSGIPPRATVTVTFEEVDGQTLLTLHTRLASADAAEAAVQGGFGVGWTTSFERIAARIATLRKRAARTARPC